LYQNVLLARDRRANPMPGQLIDVGGYRMHIYCAGQGSPPVILDSGQGDPGCRTWELSLGRLCNLIQTSKEERLMANQVKNIVLVHGGFVDGAGWEGVYKILKQAGYNVSIAQNPTISLEDDVAVTKRTLAAQDGPAVLVGHSYGGAVITEAGNHKNVSALVYIAAFAPDKGDSVGSLIKGFPTGGPQPPILPPQDGFLFLDKAKFPASFAADVDQEKAAFMADSQVPWGLGAISGTVSEPAWKTKPSWYLVTTEDRMIPPDAQRAMSKHANATVVEVKGSHAIYVSQPRAVADLIEQAARKAEAATA
jgi:pimeloyl-ACP methyl ester carboxylesterase